MLGVLRLQVILLTCVPLVASDDATCAAAAFKDFTKPKCEAPAVTHHFDFTDRMQALAVVTFQPATPNVTIRLEPTKAAVSLRLVDSFGKECVVGPLCKNRKGCEGSDPCIEYRAMKWYYSGHLDEKQPTIIWSSGVLYRPMQIVLLAEEPTTNVTLHYAFDEHPDCEQREPQCLDCLAFAGCADHDLPACSGGARVACLHMTELVISAKGEGAAPAGCQCCHLPFNPVPVDFGAAMNLEIHQSLHFTVRRSYVFFFEWLNSERGGICVGGERRYAALHLYGGRSDDEIAFLTRALIRNHGVNLLLGPYGSHLAESAAMAAHHLGAVLVAGGASYSSVFAGRPRVFGILPPANDTIGPALEILAQDPEVVVGVLIQGGLAMCQVVSHLAAQEQPTLVMGEVVTLSSEDPSDEELQSSLAQALGPTPDRTALIGCFISVDMCNRAVSNIAKGGFSPRAVVMPICLLASDFDINAGRYVMGTTSWLPDSRLPSLLPAVDHSMGLADGLNVTDSKYWHDRFVQRYGSDAGERMVVPYQAASSWTACVALATAVETANSTNPEDVAAELRRMILPTIYGVVSFDANGQGKGLYAVVQYQGVDNQPRLVAPLLYAPYKAIYPMPDRETLECHVASPQNSIWGFAGSECHRCSRLETPMVSVWNVSQHRRVCQGCPKGQAAFEVAGEPVPTASCVRSCPWGSSPVFALNGSFINCSLCEPGRHSTLLACEDCSRGRFASAAGKSICTACPPGTYAEGSLATACQECPVGKASTEERSHSCRSCTRGTYARTNGSDSCHLCDAGTVADETGATSCEVCPAGTYSAWGAETCDFCPVGRFQNLARQSQCVLGSGLGANFNGVGLTTGLNYPGYWTSDKGNSLSWEPCLYAPGDCLENGMCREGSAGRQCSSCIPGYSHVRHRGFHACFVCPPPAVNLAMTVLVALLTVALVFWLAQNAVRSTKFPQDLRFMLVKIFIFYCVMGDVCTTILVDVSQTFLYKSASTLGDTPAILARVVQWATFPLKFFPAGSPEAESPVWSVSCLLQPHDPDLANALRTTKHTDFFNPGFAATWSAFGEFQRTTEVRVAAFWVAWPITVFGGVYIISILYVWTHLTTRREYYLQALNFYDDLRSIGLKRSIRARTQDAWTAYTRSYNSRVAGLWWPIAQAEALFKGGHRSTVGTSLWTLDWHKFHHEGLPLMHAVVVLCQGGALQNTMRPWLCANFGEDTMLLMSNMLQCEDQIGLQFFALASAGVWGVLVPWGLYLHIKHYRFHTEFHDNEEVLGLLTQGYALHSWHWECWVIFVRFLILVTAHLIQSDTTKNATLLILGMGYGTLTIVFEPFQRVHNGLYGRLHAYFVLLWVLTSLIAGMIELLVQHDFMSPWLVSFTSLTAIAVHMLFILRLVWSFYHLSLATYIEGVEVRTWCKPLEEPRNRNIRTRFRRWLLGQYTRNMSRMPYICIHCDLGWVSMLGDRGDRGVLPALPVKSGRLLDLSEMPMSPETPTVKRCSKDQRRELTYALESALLNVVEILGTPIISASLLEFVVRAGFVFGAEHEKQLRKLCGFSSKVETDLDQRISSIAELQDTVQALAAGDPVQLLGSAHDPDQVRELPGRRNYWQVALRGLRKRGQESEEEEKEQRLMVEQVQQREVERKTGAMSVMYGGKPAASHLDKKRSVAYNRSIIWRRKLRKVLKTVRMLRGIKDKRNKSAIWPRADTPTLHGLQGYTGVPPDVYIGYRRKAEEMFRPGNFARGVQLSSFELGLLDILKMPPRELMCFMDRFEERAVKNVECRSKRMMRWGGYVKDQNIQIDIPDEPDDSSNKNPDEYTVTSLPKLGILAEPADPTLHRHTVNLQELAAAACNRVDRSTQVCEEDLEKTVSSPQLQNEANERSRYTPMRDRANAMALAWAHLAMLIVLPDVKAVRRVLRHAHRQSLRLDDLERRFEEARLSLEATTARRRTLERSQEEVEVNKAIPHLTPRKRVLPPARKGLYED